jgi:predicted DNA-binding WGR domain protein
VRLRDEPAGRNVVRCPIAQASCVSPLMNNPVLRLERRDPAKRMLRFYTLQILPNLFGEWGLLRGWGRIGRGGQLRIDWFATKEEAEDALRTLEKAKQRRGYLEKR